MALTNNPVHHKRTKHIDVRYHYTRELVAAGQIALVYVPTQEQLADVLTKALPRATLEHLREVVLGG